MQKVSEIANAKINLYLDVTGKREDGFHTIDGVMQSVSLADGVTLEYEEGKESEISLFAQGNDQIPTDEKNLAVRAAKLFFAQAGICGTLRISLQKRIPMAAGLAGGSADAAATLRGLNRLTKNRFSTEELCRIGAKLGADVPFCICKGAKRTRGVGEILDDCPPMPDCRLVIAIGKGRVSTPWAYGVLDERYQNFQGSHEILSPLGNLTDGLQKNDLLLTCRSMFNIFEAPVASILPEIPEIRRTMLKNGAISAMMSGSGPSVFGVFSTDVSAKNAEKELISSGFSAFICRPISKDE